MPHFTVSDMRSSGSKMGKGWSEQSVTGSMLRLWLSESGYKVVDQEKWPYANLLPRQLPTVLGLSLRWLEALLPKRRAYGYLLVARKIIVPVMPSRSKWPAIADSFMPVGAQRAGQGYSNSHKLSISVANSTVLHKNVKQQD